MFSNKFIMMEISLIPKVLKNARPTDLNRDDITTVMLSLRTRIEGARLAFVAVKMNIQTEGRIKLEIEENRQTIKSERLRTIELLGVFTAILAFIFSTVMNGTKLPLAEAIVLQGGTGLMLTTFLLGVHLVTVPEKRKTFFLIMLVILIVLLLLLPLYAKRISP